MPEPEDEEELFAKALDVVFEAGKASTSLLQRKLRIGYGKAARFLDRMENEGVISRPIGCSPRLLLLTREEYKNK